MNSIRSGTSIYSQGTVDREPHEDRFTRKLRELTAAEHEISKCKDALKQWQSQKASLEDWVKKKMEGKAVADKTPKVQTIYDNTVYTFERGKKYKNKAPTQKEIKGKIEAFFNEHDLAEFMTMPNPKKAETIHTYLYSADRRGYRQGTSFTRRTIIKAQNPNKK
tara:strand:+ start:420 stop:911 length:492 start_codon:yes stop_codon:yes gene_type:complete